MIVLFLLNNKFFFFPNKIFHALGIANFSVWVEENSYFIEQTLNYDVLVAFHS